MINNALVIGGGIGGLAAAACLARQGVAVTLSEQAPILSEVGAGLQISPNGLAVLAALGLDTALARSGSVQATSVQLTDYRGGAQVARLDLTQLKDQRYFCVHRADLIALLARAARQANVSMELGRKAVGMTPGSISEVQYEDGGRARAELVVFADGLHSIGREGVNGPSAACFTGQVAWRSIVPQKTSESAVRVTMGPGRHIVSYPLRRGELMNLVAVQERKDWADEGWHFKDDPENLRNAFQDFSGPVRDLLDGVQETHLWGLFRHPVASRWTRGGAVLMGDAAHPTLPFLAQGANMALEDAWVLAQVARKGPDLARFQQLRKVRAEKIVATATGNAWKYHLQPGPVRWAAHLGLRLGSAVAPGMMMRQFDWLYGFDVTAQDY